MKLHRRRGVDSRYSLSGAVGWRPFDSIAVPTKLVVFGVDLRGYRPAAGLWFGGRKPDEHAYRSITSVDFVNCDLRGAGFHGTSLLNVTFTSCNLADASFHRADLSECGFVGTDLSRANFFLSHLSATKFDELGADSARLRGAYAAGTGNCIPGYVGSAIAGGLGCRRCEDETHSMLLHDLEYLYGRGPGATLGFLLQEQPDASSGELLMLARALVG